MDNPCGWLPEPGWDNISELDKLTNFHGIVTSFEQYSRDWNIWYTSAEPESSVFPGVSVCLSVCHTAGWLAGCIDVLIRSAYTDLKR